MRIKLYCQIWTLIGIFIISSLVVILANFKQPIFLSGILSVTEFQWDSENEQISCRFLIRWKDKKWDARLVIFRLETIQDYYNRDQRAIFREKKYQVNDYQGLITKEKQTICLALPIPIAMKIGSENFLKYLKRKIT